MKSVLKALLRPWRVLQARCTRRRLHIMVKAADPKALRKGEVWSTQRHFQS